MTRFRLDRVAEEMDLHDVMKDPVRWLTKEIKAKRIPASKIGGHWTMTRADMEAAEEAWRIAAQPKAATVQEPRRIGLSAASQRRRLAS